MLRRRLAVLVPIAVVLILTAAVNRSHTVGAPWISLEVPANPMDPATRGAALVVHTYYHEQAARFPLRGTAHGIVKGKRTTVPLSFEKTDRSGVYAVRQQWKSEGSWILAINLATEGGPGLLVELGPDGGFEKDDYYDFGSAVVSLRSVRMVGGTIEPQRIERMLATLTSATDH